MGERNALGTSQLQGPVTAILVQIQVNSFNGCFKTVFLKGTQSLNRRLPKGVLSLITNHQCHICTFQLMENGNGHPGLSVQRNVGLEEQEVVQQSASNHFTVDSHAQLKVRPPRQRTVI